MGRNFRNIKAWQLADKFTQEIYQLTKNFPREEVYGITSQLRRAVVSVPCNIVEGATRQHDKEYLQFLYIAKGSLAEAEYLLHLSHQLGFVKNEDFIALNTRCDECTRTLHGLIRVIDKT